MTLRRMLERSAGPMASIAFHVLIVFALITFMAFKPKVEEQNIEAMVGEDVTLTLDKTPVTPVDVPRNDDVTQPTDAPSLDVEAPAVETPTASEGVETVDLSPLAPIGMAIELGRDQQTLSSLKKDYGERAAENGLYGSYFNRIDFTGETFTRIDATLNKQWELASPWPGKVRPECFSVLWTGRIVPKKSGQYTLYLQSDDGARLWINGKLVLDQYVERERAVDRVELEMLAGISYDIKYAFCDVFQHAISQLEWSAEASGIPRELIPTDCLWADGASTAEVIKWNETRDTSGKPSYANRSRMKNPAEIRGYPLSQLVNYNQLNEEELKRLQLPDLIPEYQRLAKNGKLPTIMASTDAEVTPEVEKPTTAGDDIKVEIL